MFALFTRRQEHACELTSNSCFHELKPANHQESRRGELGNHGRVRRRIDFLEDVHGTMIE